MASIDGKTSLKIDDLINSSIISGRVAPDGNLILTTRGGTEILAGQVTGGGGSASFEQVFATAANPWVCAHSLGVSDPHVVCYDSTGDKVFGDVTSTDINTIEVHWYAPMTGSCRITA